MPRKVSAAERSIERIKTLTDGQPRERLVTCLECGGTAEVKRRHLRPGADGRQERVLDCHCLSCDTYFEWTDAKWLAQREVA